MNEFMQRMFFGDPSMTDTATHTDGLFIMLWWFGVFWFVLLMGLMVYWVIKYRRRPGVPAPVSPSHNTPLEIIWTVVPSSSLLVIFLLGFWGYMDKITPAGDSVQLEINAYKWGWALKYPNGAESTWTTALSNVEDPVTGRVIKGDDYPVFVLPEDTEFNLRMISQDVIHAFWIPALRVKMDVYPNRYTGFAFRTPTLSADDTVTNPETNEPMAGRDLYVFCAEYCGDKHSQMAATIRVVPKGDYQAWLQGMNLGDLPPARIGEVTWKSKCASCHSVDGSPNVGPTWLAGASYQGQTYGYGNDVALNNGQTVPRDDNYVRESILEPAAKVVAGYPGNMPSFQGQLSEEQISGLIAYYKELAGVTDEDAEGNGAEGEAAEDEAGQNEAGQDGTEGGGD
ncbi:MAG: c-type cytochrome [Phycisphaerales bacterium JB040]